MKFKDMLYTRPDMEKVKKIFKETKEKIENANSALEQIKIIEEFANFKKDLYTNIEIANIRLSIDTTDEFYENENNFFNENKPIIETLNTEVSRAIYNSKFRTELEKEFGKHYFKLLECKLVLNEKAIPFMQKENALSTKYDKIIANSKIIFRGKEYTVSQMPPLLQNPDREFRKEAYQARAKFFEEHQEEFDNIYDEMVKVRTEMAYALGYKNYVDLQYKLLNRTDYNHEDVAKYREKVLKTLTPLAIKIREKQAERLGIKDFKYFDEACDFKDGNSNPNGDVDFIVKNAQKMYSELSPETGKFFDFMIENELMDLVAKPKKRVGGYCTSLDKYKSPFIFSNFNGTKGDIDVITHEAGHAFQCYMSQYQLLPEYVWPTYDAAEIHSMSMEFLTWPWMHLFFETDTEKYKFTHLSSALLFIPYGVTVDEFQHWVYENPEVSPSDRRKKWLEIEAKYLPTRDYGEIDDFKSGIFWFKQLHIFSDPFYYIDYTLAQVCAFQFLIKANENREEAWKDYLNLCQLGGSKSFFELMKSANLKNPFKDGTLKAVVLKIKEYLDKFDDSRL